MDLMVCPEEPWTFTRPHSMTPRIHLLFALLFSVWTTQPTASAQWTWTPLAPLPLPTANHALCAGQVSGVWNVYAFGGITTGLTTANIHSSAFRYDVDADAWTALPDIPDTLGKIASAASVVGDVAYVIGGYHVLNGAPFEISSNRVHRLDLFTDTWLPDGSPVPVPIDDQVQAVWRDSLIYVIGGWSNTTNVPNVQVFDPALDQWSVGTPLPNNNQYKAFGASGAIIGDTIYYFGGASTGSNFPAQDRMRIGVIDPLQPTTITWLPALTGGLGPRYRSACAAVEGAPTWIGGSAVSYNYNAVAYNGSGVVEPATLIQRWNGSAMVDAGTTLPHIMDLRGIGEIGGDSFVIAGGIGNAQAVLDSTWLLTYTPTLVDELMPSLLRLTPNPTTDRCTVIVPQELANGRYTIRDALGRVLESSVYGSGQLTVDLSSYGAGTYVLDVRSKDPGSIARARLIRE